jgi:c-di-GMP-binding flagellar brake protein YcgR
MTQPTDAMDRRRYPRVRVDFDADVWVSRGDKFIHVRGHLVILGEGGAFLELAKNYAIGSRLKLRFTTAIFGDIACQAVVRNSFEGKGVGTEFVDMDPADQERIAAFIERTRRSRVPTGR